MNASANPKTGLRPFLPADTPVVAAIFRASIEELTEDDYNPAQQEAWASLADDEESDRKSTRLNSSHMSESRMPSSA